MKEFIDGWNQLAHDVHVTAVQKGWWDPPAEAQALMTALQELCGNTVQRDTLLGYVDKLADRNDGEMIALFHSELSELLEGIRHGNPESEKLAGFSSAEEECADVLIRMMDTAKKRGWRVAEAVVAKMAYNETRSYKHGGKKF